MTEIRHRPPIDHTGSIMKDAVNKALCELIDKNKDWLLERIPGEIHGHLDSDGHYRVYPTISIKIGSR